MHTGTCGSLSGPGESSSTTVNQRCPGGSLAASQSTATGSPSVP